jgi:hypothetical protein
MMLKGAPRPSVGLLPGLILLFISMPTNAKHRQRSLPSLTNDSLRSNKPLTLSPPKPRGAVNATQSGRSSVSSTVASTPPMSPHRGNGSPNMGLPPCGGEFIRIATPMVGISRAVFKISMTREACSLHPRFYAVTGAIARMK